MDQGRKAVDEVLIQKRSAFLDLARKEPYALCNEAYRRNEKLLGGIFFIALEDRSARRAWADEVSRQAGLSEKRGDLADALAILSCAVSRFGYDLCGSEGMTADRIMKILRLAKERDGIDAAELLCRKLGFSKPLWPEQARAIPLEAISKSEREGDFEKAAMLASFWSIDQSRYQDEGALVSKADALRLILLSEGR